MHHLNFITRAKKSISDSKSDINHYRIADQVYQSDRKIEQLEHLKQKLLLASKSVQNIDFNLTSENQLTIYNGKVWIGENNYDTQILYSEELTYGLRFNLQNYTVNKNLISINNTTFDPTILLGPVLITHLAQNKVFCLHASAFLFNGKAFVLMGDSGTGKSTIAKAIGKQNKCTRLADDILPVKMNEDKIVLLPNFPQLKLPQECQYRDVNITEEIIFLFAKKSKQNTNIKPLEKFPAIKKLIKHSVATKLFAKNELQNHFEFCYKACSKAKNFDVNYQHSEQGLKQLIEGIHEIC